ncbi:plasmid stabilization protein [Streptomyces sp. NPDC051109]|uniref:plasmid stabilization protein n=1 Tax=Streptomyces sp. NPDC051109 TaxID=3365642 RepID=UPI0037941DF2
MPQPERRVRRHRRGRPHRGRTRPSSAAAGFGGAPSALTPRTVNKERAQSGESKTASRNSTQGKSASQRGGQRSHSGGGASSERTKDDLYQEAKRRGIEGRSSMTKQHLKNALGH